MRKFLVLVIMVMMSLTVRGSESAPIRCVAIVDAETYSAARAELSTWLMVLQDEPISDTRSHIITTSELLQELANTQMLGCGVTQ